jgi:CrcB protein
MQRILLVLLGGAIGTGLRYSLSLAIHSIVKEPKFPWATMVVNLSGCFAIGMLAELFEARFPVSPTVRIALLTGVLGGYTTFSSFAFETMELLREGEVGLAVLYALASVVVGLAAVWAGMRAAHFL